LDNLCDYVLAISVKSKKAFLQGAQEGAQEGLGTRPSKDAQAKFHDPPKIVQVYIFFCIINPSIMSNAYSISTQVPAQEVPLRRRLTVTSSNTVVHFHRPRTFLEKQPYIVGYGTMLSLVSPALTGYQLCRLYKIQKPSSQILRLALGIFPHQAALLSLQLNASTAIKDKLSPWSAFFVVGVLQGGIYGFSNVHFSKAWKLGTAAATATTLSSRISILFRGSAFAGVRDTISQGIPFMCSGAIHTNILDALFPTSPTPLQEGQTTVDVVKHWTSLISTSVAATYLSQSLHNCQTTMQTNSALSYGGAIKKVWTDHGFAALYRGAEARVGLLLIVNVLNELLLKPAWAPIQLEYRF
jgi:hypothetical protein